MDIQRVVFAKSQCLIDPSTLSETRLECTLTGNPTCGVYLPELVSNLGRIPNSPTLEAETVLCSLFSATIPTDLNLLGGDTLKFLGENFP
jgi:hypothetical protein